MKDDATLKRFAAKLEDAFDYFNNFRQLPLITIDDKGEYYVHGEIRKPVIATVKPKRVPVQHRLRTITDLADVVHEWPKFPGGGDAFLKYLEQVGKEMTKQLPDLIKKAYVQVEFIVDKDGTTTNFKIIKGVEKEFDEDLITRLEKMPVWQPAILHDKPVSKK